MFFGSGNLIFPVLIGSQAGDSMWSAFCGFSLTGVLVPFLGVLALLLYKGDSTAFFERLGKPATFWIPLLCLSIMGPFGVLARCITVSHGAFQLMLPDTPLWLFSLISVSVIFLLTVRKNRIVPILGTILTPLLLASLGAITYFGLQAKTAAAPAALEPSHSPFFSSLLMGYQTMDLLAAFFFSAFVIKHLEGQKQAEGRSLPIFFRSALVGAGLLAAIYFCLILLGNIYSEALSGLPPEEMLGTIATLALGPWAAPVVCCAVILACLTTVVVLTSLFADFLRKEVSREKVGAPLSLAITLAIAFVISTLGFGGIAAFLGPILEIVYPALIVLTVLNIVHKLWGWSIVRLPCAAALVLKIVSRFAI